MKQIYISFIRSILEQSSNVWNSSLTLKNVEDIERIQKTALTFILKNTYKTYDEALIKMDLDSLNDRRKNLDIKFAKSCLKNEKMKHLFPLNKKSHTMSTRKPMKYSILKANTERYKKSPIIHFQNILNEEVKNTFKF